MKRDGWRVVPFVSRLSHVSTKGIPFSRDLSDQCGGEKEKKKLDRFFANFWIKLNIGVGNFICVYTELYWRIGFGMLSLR